MVEMMRRMFKTRLPRTWALARGIKDRLRLEYYIWRRIRLSQLLPSGQGSWESVLPYQAVRRISIPTGQFNSIEKFIEDLDARGLKYAKGSVVVYLPPATVARSALSILQDEYPPDAGVKLLMADGGVGESTLGPGVLRKAVDRYLLLVADMLHIRGVGPRTYDLVELQMGQNVWTAYIVQHVEGRSPTPLEYEGGIAKMRAMESEGVLRNVAVGSFDGIDFEPPDCNGNAIIDGAGHFNYIDFQNFVLGDYGKYLENMAKSASEDSHFGDRRLLGGGRFLYQSVPGVKLPAKRSVAFRSTALIKMMQAAGVSVNDRLVLDIGCNIGMMMAEYLKMGAKWCHGWDFPQVVTQTERILLSIGCTRFSLTGSPLERSRRLEDDIPKWLTPSVQGCVVSYLAVHGHLGWMESLARIPWAFLIYEGHEEDDRSSVEKHLKAFGEMADFETHEITNYEDGASSRRLAAILVRRGLKNSASRPAQACATTGV